MELICKLHSHTKPHIQIPTNRYMLNHKSMPPDRTLADLSAKQTHMPPVCPSDCPFVWLLRFNLCPKNNDGPLTSRRARA